MADIVTLPAPTYVTVAILKARSSFEFPKDLSNEDLTYLIQTAETQIDGYVGPQRHHPADDNEHRVFPRAEDIDRHGAVIIPLHVTEACVAQVEWLYQEWWTGGLNQTQPLQHPVSTLNMGADGSYSEQRTQKGLDYSAATLCEQAKAKLTRFRSSSGRVSTEPLRRDPTIVPMSSRDNYLFTP